MFTIADFLFGGTSLLSVICCAVAVRSIQKSRASDGVIDDNTKFLKRNQILTFECLIIYHSSYFIVMYYDMIWMDDKVTVYDGARVLGWLHLPIYVSFNIFVICILTWLMILWSKFASFRAGFLGSILSIVGKVSFLAIASKILISLILISELALVIMANGDGRIFTAMNSLLMCFVIAVLVIVAIPISLHLAIMIRNSYKRRKTLGEAATLANIQALTRIFSLCLFGALVGPLSIFITLSYLSINDFQFLRRSIAPDEPGQMDPHVSYRITPTILIYSFIGFMTSLPFIRQRGNRKTRTKTGKSVSVNQSDRSIPTTSNTVPTGTKD